MKLSIEGGVDRAHPAAAQLLQHDVAPDARSTASSSVSSTVGCEDSFRGGCGASMAPVRSVSGEVGAGLSARGTGGPMVFVRSRSRRARTSASCARVFSTRVETGSAGVEVVGDFGGLRRGHLSVHEGPGGSALDAGHPFSMPGRVGGREREVRRGPRAGALVAGGLWVTVEAAVRRRLSLRRADQLVKLPLHGSRTSGGCHEGARSAVAAGDAAGGGALGAGDRARPSTDGVSRFPGTGSRKTVAHPAAATPVPPAPAAASIEAASPETSSTSPTRRFPASGFRLGARRWASRTSRGGISPAECSRGRG